MRINKIKRIGWVTFVLTAASANAGTLLVCPTCNHTTIQSAVNDAVDNDILNIAAGCYVENVTISGKSLTLLGAVGAPRGSTKVFAAGRGPVFTLGSGTPGDAARQILLVGLTISGGNHNGGTGVGGGVQVRARAWLRLVGCIVTGNYATFGGGVGINSPGTPTSSITGTAIFLNDAPGTTTGIGRGGGIYVPQGSSVAVDQSVISQNDAAGGGGLFGARFHDHPHSNTVNQNKSQPFVTPQGPTDGDGAGMESLGDFSISDTMFVGNASPGTNGGGSLAITLYDSGPHTITRSTFSHNTVASENEPLHGGGIIAFAYTTGTYTLDHSYVEQNLNGGGVWNSANVTAVITNTLITDNVGGNLCNPGSGCP